MKMKSTIATLAMVMSFNASALEIVSSSCDSNEGRVTYKYKASVYDAYVTHKTFTVQALNSNGKWRIVKDAINPTVGNGTYTIHAELDTMGGTTVDTSPLNHYSISTEATPFIVNGGCY